MALPNFRGWRRARPAPRPAGAGALPIGDAPRRGHVRVAGAVSSLEPTGRAGAPALEVTVDDGTGRVVALFTGRDAIPGIIPGRTLLLEGMALRDGASLRLRNPSYRLLD